MKAVKTAGSNHNFGPPPGHEDTVVDLPCQRVEDGWGDGQAVIFSVWVPNDAERKIIAEGGNVKLGVGWIGAFPPVSVGVTNEQRIDDSESAFDPSKERPY